MMKGKQKDFDGLISEVKNCKKCPRMCNRTKVLSEENGNITSKVMFIAEAPGRFGADRFGVPLHGDKSGNNFKELLEYINWKSENVFITNAVLCNPQKINKKNGKIINDKPTIGEIKNCNDYLKRTIELVKPDVIVTLGGIALSALSYINDHSFTLSESVAQKLSWNDKVLFPLYHPSNRAKRYRKKEAQMSDFTALSRLVDPKTGIKNKLIGEKPCQTEN